MKGQKAENIRSWDSAFGSETREREKMKAINRFSRSDEPKDFSSFGVFAYYVVAVLVCLGFLYHLNKDKFTSEPVKAAPSGEMAEF